MKKADENQYSEMSSDDLIRVVTEKDQLIFSLKNEVFILKEMLFGRKKERYKSDPEGMKPLFDEAESESENDEDSDTDCDHKDEVSSESEPKKTKKRGKRKPLPEWIQRVRREYDLSEEEKICPEHGKPMAKIGEDITEKLEIIPARVRVIQHVSFKYKCPCCDEGGFRQAKRDPDPIPKSFASSGLLAQIVVSKYEDALPLYRQEKIFARYQIDLNRTTMARWMIQCARLARPLYNLMHEQLLETEVIHADETVVQVLREENRRPEQKSYMWTMARHTWWDPIILFMYFNNRGSRAARDFLNEYQGTVMADGYKVYLSASRKSGFKLAGCWAHCRRKFWLAEKSAKKTEKAGKNLLASRALRFIRQIYATEKQARGKPPDKILELRGRLSKPVLAEFKQWLEEQKLVVFPSSLTGKAIDYALNQWDQLRLFLCDGRIPADNNYMESHIRPFVIGRNNWLFSDSPGGAESSAILYSLIESAKANGLDPHSYLSLIFKELPKAAAPLDFEKLLPHTVAGHYEVKPIFQKR